MTLAPAPRHTAPIYAFITGLDAQGQPQFVPGQHNIIDVLPGDAGYTAFWDVNLVQVDPTYQANTITSADDVLKSGYPILHPGLVVNCPVIRTDAAVTGGIPGMPRTGNGGEIGLLGLLALGGVLLSAGLVLRLAAPGDRRPVGTTRLRRESYLILILRQRRQNPTGFCRL